MALLTAGFWAVVATESVAWRFYFVLRNRRPITLDFIIRAELLMFGIAALLTPGIVWLTRRFAPGRGKWLAAMSVHTPASLAFAFLVKFFWDLAILPMYQTPWVINFSWQELWTSLLQGLQINATLYWVVALGVTAIDHAIRYRHIAIEAAELRAQLAEAQLETLRMQLDPHFLFNALNSISGLVNSDPDGAEMMIADLSELLRRSLDHREHEIPLREEVEFLRLYLDIQQRRFGKRLGVTYEIGRAATGALIPGMLLQPLVENSIRHAIAMRRSGGLVLIRAAIEGGRLLVLEVEDRGGSPSATPQSEGVGLRTTRERLERMYGEEHTFEMSPAVEGLLVRIRLPLHVENAHAA